MKYALLLLIAATVAGAAGIRPDRLRCEYRENPEGIDVLEPRLAWVLAPHSPAARGLRQTGYRVLVASTEDGLRRGRADLWDSGRVRSDQSIQVVYRGKPLVSGAAAFWKVQVWDQNGKASGWSAPARWSMGLLGSEDWRGQWIGRDETAPVKNPYSPYANLAKAHWLWDIATAAAGAPRGERFFRASFALPADRQVTQAIYVAAGDSETEILLNGRQVSARSGYRSPVAIEVAALLQPGENTTVLRATNGRAGKRAGAIAALRIDFTTGEPLLVLTDAAWQVSSDGAANWTAATDLGPYGMEPWGEIGFTEERTLPARQLRKEFTAEKKVRRALVHYSGLGLSELYLNGAKVGDHVLSPGLTDYDKRVFYVTFDVTNRLLSGRNALGLLLGNGRYWAPRAEDPVRTRSYGYPRALLQLDIEYQDGSRSRVVSDESWKLSTSGPILANNEYDGEEYDARLADLAWTRPLFDDSNWLAASVVAPPAGALVAQMAEPLRVTETIRAAAVNQLRPGVYIFDMGQNMVGWCRLQVSGPRGARVTLRHAETLRPDGSLYMDNLRGVRQADTYTLSGAGLETWEPRFTYHGFRYVEVSGYPGAPSLAAIEGRVVHDAMQPTADFTSSSGLLNRIHQNIYWGVRGNYRSIPTDCPQRDERQGWLGDRSQVSRGESYLFDVGAFYSKWMSDLVDSQRPSGSIPDVSPAYWTMYNDNVTWPSTFLFLPGMLYEQYGDRRVLERDYPAMKKWVDYMRGFLRNGLMTKDTYGDWCVPPENLKLVHSQDRARITNGTLIATSYYHHLLGVMARYARLLDKPADADGYESLARTLAEALQQRFFQPATALYDNGTQTSSILPLAFGLVPEDSRAAAVQALVDRIERESQGHVGTGLVGAQWLMRTLTENGHSDLAYRIATQPGYPGWGYMVEQGATTVWELWNGNTADPSMNSGNHVMQIGDLGIWMYEYLAGIRSDPLNPGFHHTVVRPYPAGDLTSVRASHHSPYGAIVSSWKREGGLFTLSVTAPANTTATVWVPTKDPAGVTESGRPAAKARAVRFLRAVPGAAVFEVESGSYTFQSSL